MKKGDKVYAVEGGFHGLTPYLRYGAITQVRDGGNAIVIEGGPSVASENVFTNIDTAKAALRDRLIAYIAKAQAAIDDAQLSIARIPDEATNDNTRLGIGGHVWFADPGAIFADTNAAPVDVTK